MKCTYGRDDRKHQVVGYKDKAYVECSERSSYTLRGLKGEFVKPTNRLEILLKTQNYSS